MKPPYAIGSVPRLSGHAIAYRWRSLPRVRRHRASKHQGSSERVLPWQVTMDQLMFAFLSHTHYWYEVSMLIGSRETGLVEFLSLQPMFPPKVFDYLEDLDAFRFFFKHLPHIMYEFSKTAFPGQLTPLQEQGRLRAYYETRTEVIRDITLLPTAVQDLYYKFSIPQSL